MRLETETLIIRRFELKDKTDLCEYMMQRVEAEFERYPDFSPEQAETVIRERVASDEFWAIELKETHKVIGNIYLGHRDFNTKELGYVLNEKYQGKGYGSEAALAVVRETFRQGTHRVYAECTPLNVPSWKLMEKIGLKREALLRKNVSFHKDEAGRPVYWDTYVYAALDEDQI